MARISTRPKRMPQRVSAMRRDSYSALRWAPHVLLGIVALLCCGGLARAGTPWASSAANAGLGQPFAIGDLDGDNRPDMASVRAAISSAGESFSPSRSRGEASAPADGNADYRVEVRLSSSGRQSFQLIAPAGGLRIEARDVNGDHAVDLVLATAWLDQPVAILVNDGRGSFARVEPEAVPAAFGHPSSGLNGWTSRPTGAADWPQPTQNGLPAQRGRAIAPSRGRQRRFSNDGFLFAALAFAIAGRSPPAQLLPL